VKKTISRKSKKARTIKDRSKFSPVVAPIIIAAIAAVGVILLKAGLAATLVTYYGQIQVKVVDTGGNGLGGAAVGIKSINNSGFICRDGAGNSIWNPSDQTSYASTNSGGWSVFSSCIIYQGTFSTFSVAPATIGGTYGLMSVSLGGWHTVAPCSFATVNQGNTFTATGTKNGNGSSTITYQLTCVTPNPPPPPPPPPPPADTTPPNTTISTKPANPTTATSASFGFSSSEAGSSFECKLDTSAYTACSSPKSYSGLAIGSHTFSVRAKDGSGNTDATPATYSWVISSSASTTQPNPTSPGSPSPTSSTSTKKTTTVKTTTPPPAAALVKATSGDTTPPTKPSNLTVAAQDNIISLSWSPSTDNVGVAGYTIERSEDQSTWSYLTERNTATSYDDSALDSSTKYSYRVRATDAAGNQSEAAYSDTAVEVSSSPASTAEHTAKVRKPGSAIKIIGGIALLLAAIGGGVFYFWRGRANGAAAYDDQIRGEALDHAVHTVEQDAPHESESLKDMIMHDMKGDDPHDTPKGSN
jgi:hypothetical protein